MKFGPRLSRRSANGVAKVEGLRWLGSLANINIFAKTNKALQQKAFFVGKGLVYFIPSETGRFRT